MIPCPGCRYLVPDSWTECKRCGARLPAVVAAAPVPAPPLPWPSLPPPGPPAPEPEMPPAPAGTLGGAPPDDFYVRADAFVRVRPPEPTRRPAWHYAVPAAAVLLAAAGLWLVLGGDDGSPSAAGSADTPAAGADGADGGNGEVTVLPPIGADGGLPTIGDVARVEAEANLHGALMPVMQIYAETGSYASATPEQLAGYDPRYTYVGGQLESQDADEISVWSPAPDTVTLAALAGEDRCAFARVDISGTPSYLTAEGALTCSAASAPATGWDAGLGASMPEMPGPEMPGMDGVPGMEEMPGMPAIPGMDI